MEKQRKKILVLGAGLVGFEIARCLAETYEVTVVDKSIEVVAKLDKIPGVTPVNADFMDAPIITELCLRNDVIVGAMPGSIAFKVLECVVKTGKRAVDISFFDEDPFALDKLARENGSTLVVDCGLAPGLSNLLLGHETTLMDISHFEFWSGGLPVERSLPWQYYAPFAVRSVLDLWTRPVRSKVNGVVVVKPALTDYEFVEISGIGTLEAIPTDGLRTLLDTVDIPNMIEKTLRYPGHRACLETLRDLGMFLTEPIDIGGIQIAPIEVTSRMLEEQWKLGDTDDEFTMLHLMLLGIHNRKAQTVFWDLFDQHDFITGATSMARTTGYTCLAVAHLLAEGAIEKTGIIAPEILGKNQAHFDFIMNFLHARGVECTRHVEILFP